MLPKTNENNSFSLQKCLGSLINISLPSSENIELSVKCSIFQVNKFQFNSILALILNSYFFYKTNITNSIDYEILHWKLLMFDNLHVIWSLASDDERKMCCKKLLELLLLKKY